MQPSNKTESKSLLADLPSVSVIEGCKPDSLPDDLFDSAEPILLKGLVGDWPAVQRCVSLDDTAAYLSNFWSEKPVTAYVGDEQMGGRFFYNDDCTGFNYESQRAEIGEVFARIRDNENNPEHPYFYIQSLVLNEFFPGLRARNDLDFNHPDFADNEPSARIWIGTESIASAHYDLPNNIACCVVGRRRFTLFGHRI